MENKDTRAVIVLTEAEGNKTSEYITNSSGTDIKFVSNGEKEDELILELLTNESAKNLIPIFVTCGILMLVGIIGNSLVVRVYWYKMRSSAKRTFILALALLDLTVCIVVIPFEMYDLQNQVMFYYDGLCKAMRFVEYATILSAGFVLVSVSFERYYFLCRAFQEFTPRKAKAICFACLTFAMLVSAPSTLFAGSKTRHLQYGHYNVTGCECSMNSEHDFDEVFKRIYYYALATIFFGCFTVFIVIYIIIGRLLWKYQTGKLIPEVSAKTSSSSVISKKKHSSENSSGQSHRSCNSERSTSIHGKRCIKSTGSIVIFFSVTVVFVLSFLPHLTIRLMLFFGMDLEEDLDRETSELLYNFIVRSYLLSNVANPFIYSILNHSFRKELKRTFKRFQIRRPQRTFRLIQRNERRRYIQ